MNEYVSAPIYGLDMTIMLIYILILGVALIVGIAEYILQGMGLYKLAQAQGIESPWMAFVPWLRTYLHGKVAGTISFGKKEIKNPGIWMVVAPLILGGIIAGMYFVLIAFMIIGAIGSTGITGGSGYIGGVIMMILLFIILGFIMIAAVAYAAFTGVLRGMVNYQIFKRFHSESTAVFHMLLSLFVPMYQAIYFFMLRKRVHVAPKPQSPYCMPQQKEEIAEKEQPISNS